MCKYTADVMRNRSDIMYHEGDFLSERVYSPYWGRKNNFLEITIYGHILCALKHIKDSITQLQA